MFSGGNWLRQRHWRRCDTYRSRCEPATSTAREERWLTSSRRDADNDFASLRKDNDAVQHSAAVPAAAPSRWHVMDAAGYWRRRSERPHINTLNWLPAGIAGVRLTDSSASSGTVSVQVDGCRRQLAVLGRRIWIHDGTPSVRPADRRQQKEHFVTRNAPQSRRHSWSDHIQGSTSSQTRMALANCS